MAVSLQNCTQSVDLTFFQDKQSTVVPILKINVFAVLHLCVCVRMRYTQFSNFMQRLL